MDGRGQVFQLRVDSASTLAQVVSTGIRLCVQLHRNVLSHHVQRSTIAVRRYWQHHESTRLRLARLIISSKALNQAAVSSWSKIDVSTANAKRAYEEQQRSHVLERQVSQKARHTATVKRVHAASQDHHICSEISPSPRRDIRQWSRVKGESPVHEQKSRSSKKVNGKDMLCTAHGPATGAVVAADPAVVATWRHTRAPHSSHSRRKQHTGLQHSGRFQESQFVVEAFQAFQDCRQVAVHS